MDAKDVDDEKKLRYPRSVFFIISNEFCERFAFYGMRTVLTLYLRNKLGYDTNTSTMVYHVFTCFVYFFPLFGAMIADSWLGKFRTIFYLSIVYLLGQVLLSLSAVPTISIPPREFTIVGLLLIAVGTGGIKPCVSAFGGDQFVLPQQERYLSTFFSLFYFSINSGSLISSFLTPLLRTDVTCFGENTCYALSFFVPAVLMAVSVVIFLVGKPLYRAEKPTQNVVLNVSKCVSHAVYNKATLKCKKREHWLDYADDKFDHSLINDIKAALQVLVLFIPIPIFWALFDQQGSRWTFQATDMNGEIGSFNLQPDQMQVVNPLLILAFIPIFDTCIYPLLGKIGLNSPLKKLTIGGLLASLSFVVSALVEFQLEKTYPILPSEGVGQLRLFNTLNCPVNVALDNDNVFDIHNLDMWVDKNITVKGDKPVSYELDFTECIKAGIVQHNQTKSGSITVQEAEALSYAITPEGFSSGYKDSVEKSKSGDPLVRGLVFVEPSKPEVILKFMQNDQLALNITLNETTFYSSLEEIKFGTYDIYVDKERVKRDINLKRGGVYTVIISNINKPNTVNIVSVTEPNSMHMLWLLPQYIIMTMGEVMFSVTGLEFAFTEAPLSMKSLLQANWQLTVAVGNLIVVIIAEASIFNRQVFEFLLFAGLMFVDIVVFAIIAKFYKYAKRPDENAATEDIQMELNNGTSHVPVPNDEK